MYFLFILGMVSQPLVFKKKKLECYFLKGALWVTSMYKKDKSGSAPFEGGPGDRPAQ